ncbi:MAG: hypothetical protein IJT94_05910 [Oscillibacter sp.]|nr:hypothetical protein [Oscillibacter sp.]
MTITKHADGTTTPIPGVTFYVTDGAGTPIGSGEFVTDDNGRILIPGLVPGTTVIAREVKTVKGYSLNGIPKNIQIASGQDNSLVFYDSPLATLVLHKYVEGTDNQPLPGVTFKVVDGSGKNVGNSGGLFVTDAAGDITIPNLEAGTVVKAREVKTVDGYVLDGTAQDIQIQSGELHELTFYNTPKKGLIIRKYIADSTTPIPGVTFHISDVDGKAFGSSTGDFTTDSNGEIVLDGLTPGDVLTVREIKAASGFVLDDTPQTIRINRVGGQSLAFYNRLKGSLTVRKIDAATETPLSGADFKITTLQGEPLDDYEGRVSTGGIYRTDENGEILLRNVQPGAYRVTEVKAPEGYYISAEAQTVTVNADDAQTVVFRDNALQSVTIQKFIDGTTKPLPGVTFLVTDANGANIGAGKYVTDANGRIVLTGLIPGTTVIAREVKTVKGYSLNGTPQVIQVGGSSGTASLLRNAGLASLAAVNSGNSAGGGTGNGTTSGTGNGTASGTVTSTGTSGTSAASTNTGGNTITFYDSPLSTLIIHKYIQGTDNQPLPGVTFKVVDGSGKNVGNSDGIYVTDDSGDIEIPGLEQGTVVKVREIQTVEGYVLDGTPQDIEIRNSELHELTFWNAPKQRLTISKYVSGTTTPIPGTAFLVTEDGRPVGSTSGEYLTDENGRIVLENLNPGAAITVKEIRAAEGYVLDGTPKTVRIKSGPAQSVTFYNAPEQRLVIQKYATDSTTPIQGAAFHVTDTDGKNIGSSNGDFVTNRNGQIVLDGLIPGQSITAKETKAPSGYVLDSTPQTIKIQSGDVQTMVFYNAPKGSLTVVKQDRLTERPLSGAEFKVTTTDGKLVDQDEGRTSTNGIYRTDENGRFLITGLNPGSYVVTETKAPEGYALDADAQTVKVNDNDAQTLTFRDSPEQRLIIQKYAKGTTKPIPGAAFLIADNGKPVGVNNGEYLTDENGQIVLENLTPGATITAKEIRAAEGYVLDGTPKSITIKSGATQGLFFYNVPEQRLVIQKYAADSTTPIQGAAFHVTDTDGKNIGSSNGDFVTDRNGQIVISGLTPGMSVTAVETKAASGYVLDSTPQTVKIQSGKAQTVVFYNAPKSTLTVVKRDRQTDALLFGAEFKVTTADGKLVDQDEGRTSTNGIYRTDENGQFIIAGLNPGTYVVTETKAPEGYALDADAQTVKVNANDAQTVTFRDTALQTLTITKYVEGTTKPLPGVTFLVTDSSGANIGAGQYVTDETGRIVLTGLTPGTTVMAREVKTVRGYALNGTPQIIQIGDGSAALQTVSAVKSAASGGNALTFTDSPLSTLVIHNYVEGTDSQPLPGSTFKVLDGSGKPVGNSDGLYTADEHGNITIPELEQGTVLKVRQVKTVDGYLLNGQAQDIEIRSSDLHELTFWNTPKSSLTVVKLDRLTERPLSGAEFKVTTADGAAVDQDEGRTSTNGIYRTDEHGRFTISGLNPGSYVVTETKAPQGYVLDADAQTVKVNANDAQTLTFRDSPTQALTVEIYVTDSDTPIPGTAFLIVDQDGKPVGSSNGEFIADENGRITIPGLAPGMSITVKEIRAADGFILDGTPKTILIKSGEAQSLRFYNSPTQTLKIALYEAGTTDPIAGASFHVTDGDGKNIGNSNGDFTTDRNGKITIPGLIHGVTITAKETQTVSGFVLDTTPQTITIREGGVQSQIFFNAPKGALVLKAQDSVTEQLLPGVEFRITAASGEPLDSNEGQTSSGGIYRTDDTGHLTLTKVQPGIYTIVETKAPEGYVLNEEPQTVEIRENDTQTVIFRNIPKQTLTIQVYESGTTKPISGVALLLKDSGGAFIGPENGEYVTDGNGQITVSGLTPGVTVVAREIRTVSGYVLNSAPQSIKIETGDAQKLTFFNVPTQILTIQKFQKGTTKPLQGVAFIVTDGAGKPLDSGEYVTDENGCIVIDGLEPGMTVTAREIRTIQGYQLNGNPQNIQISAERQNVLTFYDDPLSTLILRLYVDGTENEPLSGAAFKVVDGSGKSVGPDDGVYYTDKAGMVTLDNLEPGTTIKARLIKLPDGFVLDGTPQDILMESGSVQSLTYWAKRSGSLTIRALDSVTRSGVPHAEYKVTYADGRPVDTANGSVSSSGRFFTDSNGEIRITGIAGTVIVTEEQTASGYTMDAANRTQTVVVNPADGQTLTFFDTPAQQLTVQLYVKGTTTPISGARFLLTDGTGAKLGDQDGEFVTDENGRFSLSGLASGAVVKVKQLSTPDGYLNDSAAKTITIKTGNEQSVTLYNSPKQTLIVKLYEKGTTTPIAGGKFLLKDSGGAFVGENNGVYTTDRNGEFTITGLTPGATITAVQTETVSGYVLDSTAQSILIKSGNAQSLVFYNAVKGAVTVRKIDAATEKPLAGAEFKILTIGGAPVDDNEGRTSTQGIYRTDENGEINLLKLEPGVYTVTETKAPAGYVLDSQPQTVTVNAADHQTVVFRDTALQTLTITKYEEGTTKPLAGVVFLITDADGNRIGAGEYTTDANGQITISGLTPGMTVIAREVRTVKGYVLNGAPQTIRIGTGANAVTSGAASGASGGAAGPGAAAGSSGNSLVFYDEPLSVLVIRKFIEGTDNEPLSNVEFKVTDGKGAAVGNGTFYTDRNGEIKVENLQPGTTVKVRETKTAPGYVLDGTPQTAEIPSGDVLELTFWNSRKQTLTINKYRTGTTTPIPGTAFLVTDQTGAPVGASNGEFVTDENGRFSVELKSWKIATNLA